MEVGAYTEKVDIWSLGVVLFEMLSGTPAFSNNYGSPVADQIKHGKYNFQSSNWNFVTSTVKHLIQQIL